MLVLEGAELDVECGRFEVGELGVGGQGIGGKIGWTGPVSGGMGWLSGGVTSLNFQGSNRLNNVELTLSPQKRFGWIAFLRDC